MSLFGQVWVYSLASFVLGILLDWLLRVRPLSKREADLERLLAEAKARANAAEATLTEQHYRAKAQDEDWDPSQRPAGVPGGVAPGDLFAPRERNLDFADLRRGYGEPGTAIVAGASAFPEVDEDDDGYGESYADDEPGTSLFQRVDEHATSVVQHPVAEEYEDDGYDEVPAGTSLSSRLEPEQDTELAEDTELATEVYPGQSEYAAWPAAGEDEFQHQALAGINNSDNSDTAADWADAADYEDEELTEAEEEEAASRTGPVSAEVIEAAEQLAAARQDPLEADGYEPTAAYRAYTTEEYDDYAVEEPVYPAAPAEESELTQSLFLPKSGSPGAVTEVELPRRPLPVASLASELPGESSVSGDALFAPAATQARDERSLFESFEPNGDYEGHEFDEAQDAPFGPGSALPLPDGSAPAAEFTVKARRSSMVFHTESSPFYDRLDAQVWFRTTSDAERAGFTRWERPGAHQ